MAPTQFVALGRQPGGICANTDIKFRSYHGIVESSTVDAVRSIYCDSFPASERVDFTVLIADIMVGQRQLHTVIVDGNVIAFAVTILLPNTKFMLLEYIAVHRSMRDQGIGGLLLERIIEDAKAEMGNRGLQGLISEVEDPESTSGPERNARERRIRFYLRHGARSIECAPRYCIPNLETGTGTVPMLLLWIPIFDEAQKITGPILEACIRGIYRSCYDRGDEDPILKKTLQDLTC